MATLDRKLVRDLRRIWAQALAIALVIASGVAMVVMAYGMLRTLQETRTAYYERYRFADIFAHITRAPVGVAARIAQIPGVAVVEDRIVGGAIVEIEGFVEPITGRLVSLPATGAQKLNRLVLREGRWPLPAHDDEAIVSELFAEAHGLRPGAKVSVLVNGRRQELRLVGVALSPEFVYAIDPGSLFPDNRRFGIFWMSREALAAAYNLDGAFNDVTLTLRRGASEASVIAALDRILEPYGSTGAYPRRDQTSEWFLSGELDQLALMVRFAPVIFLGVAMFLLHIAMSRLIDTERQEIGLLKAFGYSDAAIAWHYAKFAVVISATGIVLGSLAGTWLGDRLANLYMDFFRFPFLTFVLSPEVYAAAALIALATALAGVAAPAYRAARLPPAVAMRPPAPPNYRTTLLERIGLTAFMTSTMRMVVRHALRWPLRSGLTVASTALAVGLYVSSAFVMDAMEHLIDVEYNRAQRQHMSVVFNEPVPPEALTGIAALPGVLRVEGVRAVAVRIRHGHLVQRKSVGGIDPDATLSQLLDLDLRPISPPAEGIALSGKLAELVGVVPGDVVRIEVLEGRRPVFEVPVVRLVEQYVGAGAYMDQAVLARYLGEGPRLSAARLLIDTDRHTAVYQRLKEMPLVGGISDRIAERQVLRATIEESLSIMTAFNIGFAALIALGVVYNAARISLSERGHELASLMVLGYSRVEAAAILVGEIALLTLIALPIGCAAGWLLAGLLATAYETDLYRVPFIVHGSTYGMAMLVVIVSAIGSALVVARRVGRLDLIAVLKTRE